MSAGQRLRRLGTRPSYRLRSAPRTPSTSHAPRGLTGPHSRSLAPFRSLPRPLPHSLLSHIHQPPASPPLGPDLHASALQSGPVACAGAVATVATRGDGWRRLERRPTTMRSTAAATSCAAMAARPARAAGRAWRQLPPPASWTAAQDMCGGGLRGISRVVESCGGCSRRVRLSAPVRVCR